MIQLRLDKPCKISPNVYKNHKYPVIRVGNKEVSETRYVLEQKLGRPIKPDHEACHHCDVPACVEEEHLFEGTHFQNMRDASRKDRIRSGNSWGDVNAKKTHCPQGHEYSGSNLYINGGKRICRACQREAQRAYKLRKKDKVS